MKAVIYGIVHPYIHHGKLTRKKIRYIGQTIRTKEQRLSQHLSETIYENPKNVWLKKLKKRKIRPEVIEICEVDVERADMMEAMSIFYYKYVLMNNKELLNLDIANNHNLFFYFDKYKKYHQKYLSVLDNY
ncbi:hypothetical protein EV201_1276 [Ancylomarina subtilis]|uniref:GIY-YIG domain-containing protein n=1 Tax=Ancylomarina subtilis TaxID=1639035 RepID=A0A4V2FT39_9BACT|nr:hypothetical protein [Ancylomarina subtilis]RZT96635.1 hypothetical protein EV201_1276 [Ancylomarina subtilis]